MELQSALGPARPGGPRGVRYREPLSGVGRAALRPRKLPEPRRKGQFCQGADDSAAGREARPAAQSDLAARSEIGWSRAMVRPTTPPMMTLAIHDHSLAKPGPQQSAAMRDYDSVR